MTVLYDVDLQTKRNESECNKIWDDILITLQKKMEATPKELHDEQINYWCSDLAAKYKLHFYRSENNLQFCDVEFAPN